MTVIKNEYTTFWDIDDTLVMHDLKDKGPLIKVKDPVSDADHIEVVVNMPMLRLMKEEKHRGATIVVWSRGGFEWAANVVSALGLSDIVDIVMTKPESYMDDKEIAEWLQHRVYLPPDAKYKNVYSD